MCRTECDSACMRPGESDLGVVGEGRGPKRAPAMSAEWAGQATASAWAFRPADEGQGASAARDSRDEVWPAAPHPDTAAFGGLLKRAPGTAFSGVSCQARTPGAGTELRPWQRGCVSRAKAHSGFARPPRPALLSCSRPRQPDTRASASLPDLLKHGAAHLSGGACAASPAPPPRLPHAPPGRRARVLRRRFQLIRAASAASRLLLSPVAEC